MKSYKDRLNDLARISDAVLRQLTEEESVQLKALLLDMYKDFAQLCDTHGLTYMLGGGSCLGAVRHKGFIPWDDDMDINMPRQDYEKLKNLLMSGVLDEKYEFTCPNSGKDAPCCFLKIYRKNTLWMGMGGEYSPYPKGVCLDVFIMDGAPQNRVCRFVKGVVSDAIRFIANIVSEAHSPLTIRQKVFYSQDNMTYLIVMLRRCTGFLFSFVSHRRWIDMFDDFVKCEVPDSGLVTFPTGRSRYAGETMDVSTHLPVKEGMFEGVVVNLPAKAEEYLRHNYGDDYMQVPGKEKRECHFVVDFDLNTKLI